MNNDIVLSQGEPEANPMAIIQMAIQQGAGVEQLERLMGLQERWQANRAKAAYVQAMAAFKADPPKIYKDKLVSFDARGGRTEYRHASLGKLCEAVIAGLSRHGLHHAWSTEQSGDKITVTCIITHELGHSERCALTGSADTSGSKNPIQAVGSAVTYLQRYTLLSATGLATEDDDGSGSHERTTAERGTVSDPWKQQEQQDEGPLWQELYPDAWKNGLAPNGSLLGDVYADTGGDSEMWKLWIADKTNPALCAWGAGHMSRTLHKMGVSWEKVRAAVPALPEFDDMTAAHLWVLAKWIQSEKKTRKEKEAA